MDLLVLIQKTRDQLLSHWVLSISVCIVYSMLIAIPSELNSFGEILSLLIAGPLQLGLCIYFLKIWFPVPEKGPSVRIAALASSFDQVYPKLSMRLIMSLCSSRSVLISIRTL